MIVSMKSGLVLTLLLVLAATVKAQEKLTAEDILQRHLDSVGTPPSARPQKAEWWKQPPHIGSC
jgi:hypothetical protein